MKLRTASRVTITSLVLGAACASQSLPATAGDATPPGLIDNLPMRAYIDQCNRSAVTGTGPPKTRFLNRAKTRFSIRQGVNGTTACDYDDDLPGDLGDITFRAFQEVRRSGSKRFLVVPRTTRVFEVITRPDGYRDRIRLIDHVAFSHACTKYQVRRSGRTRKPTVRGVIEIRYDVFDWTVPLGGKSGSRRYPGSPVAC